MARRQFRLLSRRSRAAQFPAPAGMVRFSALKQERRVFLPAHAGVQGPGRPGLSAVRTSLGKRSWILLCASIVWTAYTAVCCTYRTGDARPGEARTMADITIETTGRGRLAVTSPYDTAFVSGVKDIGGRWDAAS